jgi:hypothetical protein
MGLLDRNQLDFAATFTLMGNNSGKRDDTTRYYKRQALMEKDEGLRRTVGDHLVNNKKISIENQDNFTKVQFVALQKQLSDWLGEDRKDVSQSLVKMCLLMMKVKMSIFHIG